MNNHHYNKELREYAHELRTQTISRAEKYLWKAVLSRSRTGVKFKRQRPIYRFIVDFFSQEIALVVEVDGNSHADRGSYDNYRQQKIESLGYTVVRFTEGEILQNVDAVARQLEHVIHCLKHKHKHKILPLNPLQRGRYNIVFIIRRHSPIVRRPRFIAGY
jgi:very-short-patch-repair endonuclease